MRFLFAFFQSRHPRESGGPARVAGVASPRKPDARFRGHDECRRRLAVFLAALVVLTAPAAAADTDPPPRLSEVWAKDAPQIEERCETVDLRYAGAPAMRVTTGGFVPLFLEKKPCLRAQTCPWVSRTALAPGTLVLAGPQDKGFRCVYFAAAGGTLAAGFVPAERLAAVEKEERAIAWQFLTGDWRDGAMRILIGHTRGGTLRIRATGTYRGTGGVNEGGFAADIPMPKGEEIVRVQDDGCAVVFERRGPFLLVNDNARCGGHNVRFVGFYLKATPRR